MFPTGDSTLFSLTLCVIGTSFPCIVKVSGEGMRFVEPAGCRRNKLMDEFGAGTAPAKVLKQPPTPGADRAPLTVTGRTDLASIGAAGYVSKAAIGPSPETAAVIGSSEEGSVSAG